EHVESARLQAIENADAPLPRRAQLPAQPSLDAIRNRTARVEQRARLPCDNTQGLAPRRRQYPAIEVRRLDPGRSHNRQRDVQPADPPVAIEVLPEIGE